MLKNLLSEKIWNVLCDCCNLDNVHEVRLRVGKPVVVSVLGVNICLKNKSGDFVVAERVDIERVVCVASKHSLYTVENQLKQAFITAEKGYRIGISGEIAENLASGFKTIKNIYSVNIRVPHEVLNCSASIYKFIKVNGKVLSTLIIAPPGAGKTTYLRDICYQISKESSPSNILVVDERYELAGVKDGVPTVHIGDYCDILSGASKEFGFGAGIRSLSPDYIITDELGGCDDVGSVFEALNAGVRVIATIHAEDVDQLQQKPEFEKLMTYKCFDRYIVLSKNERVGKCVGVYDRNFKCLFT